jgi:hypothetical protein
VRGGRSSLYALLLLAWVAMGTTACGGGSGDGAPGSGARFPAPPLASTLVGGDGGTWVTVPMRPAGAAFYELFRFSPAAGRWQLVTPPGVATTGGLVLAGVMGTPGAAGSLVTAFVAAGKLGFSPLATTGDGGRSWVPGTLPGPIVPSPDALSGSPGGSLLALVQGAGGGIETAAFASGPWRLLAAAAEIEGSAGGRACEPASLTAVVVAGPGRPPGGAACQRPGVVGVLAAAGGTWRLAGPVLPPGTPSGAVEVVRLTPAGTGLLALFGVAARAGEEVVASWLDRRGWSSSPALRLRPGDSLVASGTTIDGGCYVLLSGGSGQRLLVDSPAGAWQGLPPPPAGTEAAAFLAGGRADILVVHGARLVVETLGAGGHGWSPVQAITVPLATAPST